MERTFNQGVGMVAVLPAAEADRALAVLASAGVASWVAGEVEAADGAATAELTGAHPA